MTRTPVLLPWIAGSLLCVVPASARAEIAIGESAEWVLATSDRAFVGKVVQVDKVLDEEKKECQAVTVTISKTLKGEHTERATFVLPSYIYAGYAQQWMDEGIPIIFCLVKNNGRRVTFPREKFPWALREDGKGPSAILLGKSKHYWTGCIPVLTRKYEVLTDPDAILRFVEQTVKASVAGKSPKSHAVEVPGETAVYKELWGGSAVYLVVPVDNELEALDEARSESWRRIGKP